MRRMWTSSPTEIVLFFNGKACSFYSSKRNNMSLIEPHRWWSIIVSIRQKLQLNRSLRLSDSIAAAISPNYHTDCLGRIRMQITNGFFDERNDQTKKGLNWNTANCMSLFHSFSETMHRSLTCVLISQWRCWTYEVWKALSHAVTLWVHLIWEKNDLLFLYSEHCFWSTKQMTVNM
jgi:hypothetical protein